MLRLAGGRWSPFAVVEHQGRRSGRAYEVPVEPFVLPVHVLIALPWGPGTNWVRNVLSAGGCDMRWQGATIALTNPRVVAPDEALPMATGWKGAMLRRLGFNDFLLLDREPNR
jgi:deazaflavin-dependent oxidoreductase (nitroreductase family)